MRWQFYDNEVLPSGGTSFVHLSFVLPTFPSVCSASRRASHSLNPLTFFAFVIGEDVREDAPGDVLDFVLRNTGIVDELLFAAQAGCSLRFDMKFLRCSCGRADDLLLTAWLLSQETENAGACQANGLMGVCILFSYIISHWKRVSIAWEGVAM